MRHLSPKHLRELAALCGGAALLVGIAVFVSGVQHGDNLFAQLGIAPASQTGCIADCGIAGYPIVTMSATPNPITSGGYSTVSFSAQGTGSDGSTINCGGVNGEFIPGGGNYNSLVI